MAKRGRVLIWILLCFLASFWPQRIVGKPFQSKVSFFQAETEHSAKVLFFPLSETVLIQGNAKNNHSDVLPGEIGIVFMFVELNAWKADCARYVRCKFNQVYPPGLLPLSSHFCVTQGQRQVRWIDNLKAYFYGRTVSRNIVIHGSPVFENEPLAECGLLQLDTLLRGLGGHLRSFGSTPSFIRLPANESGCDSSDDYQYPLRGCVPTWHLLVTALLVGGSLFIFNKWGNRNWVLLLCGCGYVGGVLFGLAPWGKTNCHGQHYCGDKGWFHFSDIVPQKYFLTTTNYWGTVIGIGRAHMPNVLSIEKQIAVIGALAEGSSIRSIERITGVHRDTIMRLGVRVGKGCAKLLDAKMRDLSCQHLQFDEIWGFIGKKERHCKPDDSLELGDVWTFCAIDSDTKLVPSFKVGKRDSATANAFVADVAGRMKNRVQISSDALRAYVEAVEGAFGANVDFAQIVKTYVNDGAQNAEREYSAAEFVIEEKKAISGFPDMRLASTSHVERLNGTTRLHMRRLTRLTYAFSKKLENFEAAVALHFAYYNFVKRHITLRATPAMAAGIERDFWTVGDLVEAAA